MVSKGHRPGSGRFRFNGRGGVVLLVLLSLPALIIFTISRGSGSGLKDSVSEKSKSGADAPSGASTKVPHVPVVPSVKENEGGSLTSRAAAGVADFVAGHPKSVYDFSVTAADGSEQSLEDFDGSVLLIVNVASNCGFTDVNYRELQDLQQRYHGQAFSVIAFPCNQFGGQEPGTIHEIEEFAHSKYKVTFPIMSKIEVNGPGTSPLFAFLKNAFFMKAVPWNFQKFLCDSHGRPVHQFASQVDPSTIKPYIDKLLAEAI